MLKCQVGFFFGEYLVLIGPEAEMFSSADRQVQAGRFHFSKQQELLLTQQQQVLQAGLAGHRKVTTAFSRICLSLFPPPYVSPFLSPYLFILTIAIHTEQILALLHLSRS